MLRLRGLPTREYRVPVNVRGGQHLTMIFFISYSESGTGYMVLDIFFPYMLTCFPHGNGSDPDVLAK